MLLFIVATNLIADFRIISCFVKLAPAIAWFGVGQPLPHVTRSAAQELVEIR